MSHVEAQTGKGRVMMAALLSEEGRFPAVQEISEAEYTRFVETCQNPPAPTQKLRDLLRSRSEVK
jgi:uncharacterized protein (DUF1778 family)